MSAPPEAAPAWLTHLVDAVSGMTASELSRVVAPEEGGRQSAVLLLFGDRTAAGDEAAPYVLLIERAHDMRSHAGQVAFPGGAVDDTDADAVAAALREAHEETGLDPAGVTVLGQLPALFVPPSGFVVTPVLGWWHAPSEVGVRDSAEVASVLRVRLDTLADPANRASIVLRGGYVGPAFTVHDLVVWGFTGGLLDRLLARAGWERPWSHDRMLPHDLLPREVR